MQYEHLFVHIFCVIIFSFISFYCGVWFGAKMERVHNDNHLKGVCELIEYARNLSFKKS